MSERVLLSTYIVKILDNNKNEQILSHFNGSQDFLETFQHFTNSIFTFIERQSDIQNQTTLHLTLDRPAVVNLSDRKIHGYFSSGVSGERFDVRNINTNETEFEVEPNTHASFRNVFFYFYIPASSRVGYLILQRKSKFGVKTILKKVLNKYIRENGFSNYFIEVNNLVHNRVYERMFREGNLKKVEFVKRRIPNSFEEFIENGENTANSKGTLKTSISSHSSLPERWRGFIDRLYRNRSENNRIEILGEDEFDEVEFELELRGKKKTFYIVNHQRTQPDIDVTLNVVIENGEPTEESMLIQSQSLITDMLEVNINDSQN